MIADFQASLHLVYRPIRTSDWYDAKLNPSSLEGLQGYKAKKAEKIVNGGWCGWKKAVDSKGKNFFLHVL
ncbi:hypothetical protein HN51_065152 [Arachis hypogaea]